MKVKQITAYRKRVERRGPLARGSTKKLTVLMINMFIAVGSFGIIIPILPAYLASIGQGGTAAGLMIAIFAGAQLVMSPIAGKWADQYGRRKMIIYGLIGLTLSMFVFYFSNSVTVLYISRAIGGAGAALLIPAIFAYVADITTMDQRAKGNSYVSAAMSLGIVIGPGIGGFLAEYDLKLPLLVSTIVSGQPSCSAFCYFKKAKHTMRQRWHQTKVRCSRNSGRRLRNRTSSRSSLHSS